VKKNLKYTIDRDFGIAFISYTGNNNLYSTFLVVLDEKIFNHEIKKLKGSNIKEYLRLSMLTSKVMCVTSSAF